MSTQNPVNQNDGVVVYYKNTLAGILIEEPPLMEASALLIKPNPETAIISIYRPPQFRDKTKFINSLNILLESLRHFKNIIIIGDINIDISPLSKDPDNEDYLNVTVHHGLLPAHSLPTRFPSATCLDHALLKSPHSAMALVISSTITDHSSVLLSLDTKVNRSSSFRTLSKVDYHGLSFSLINADFSSVFNTNDPNQATDNLMGILQTYIKTHSIKIHKTNRRRTIKPWITTGLLRCIRNRDKMHNKLRKQPHNDMLRFTYFRYRNFCNSLLRKLKKNYEKSLLANAGTNAKKLWNAIKEVSHLNKSPDHCSSLLHCKPTPGESVDHVNSFFVGIGRTLAENISPGNLVGAPVSNTSTPQSFVLLPVTNEEVECIILSLRDNCAVGWDNIPTKILRQNAKILAPAIAHICNVSMATGIFPSAFKKATVHPIYKSGDRGRVDNYRPISILTALSKILERLINLRLVKYLEDKHLLSPNQFGFRRNRSATDAVHDLTTHIARNLDSGNKCVGVFLDFKKAFDTVSIPILLQRLESLGIRGTQLELFTSYLSERKQCVVIDGHPSSYLPIEYGVPQGSILGPTLFLVYINGLCSLNLPECKIISYADDTALLFTADNWKLAFDHAQAGLNCVTEWLRLNLLTLNIQKTCFLTFSIYTPPKNSTSYTLTAHSHPTVSPSSCSCPPLICSKNIKYLGIHLDDRLSFEKHLKITAGRVRKLIYVFKKLRHVADTSVLKMVYTSLCESILTYGITSWGGAAKSHLLCLERAQRALLKVCKFKPILFPTTDLYRLCQVLTVRQLYILNTILKQHQDKKPFPFSSRSARNPPSLVLECFNTSFSHRFHCFMGPFLYNKLNRTLLLHKLLKYSCKREVTNFLIGLDYNETENLIQPLK